MKGELGRFLRGAALLPGGVVPDAAIEILGTEIGRVLVPGDVADPDATTLSALARGRPADLLVAPGFVDLHVHGGGGADFMDGQPGAFEAVLAAHAAHGTTSLLATTLAAPEEALVGVLGELARFRAGHPRGGAVLGYHVEGPMLCAAAAGAQDRRFLRTPTASELDAWWRAGEVAATSSTWVVTLAPELPGADEVIDLLVRRGALPSLGHSHASHAVATSAIARGARRGTHLWNAMGPLHHREPGVAGALLEADGVPVEVIADGVHLHAATLRLVRRLRREGEVLLVTDATRLAGAPAASGPARGRLLDATVELIDGVPRLPDGTIAGSVLHMDRAVSVWAAATGATLAEALRAASEHPAASIGAARKGRIAPGMDADLVVLDVGGAEVSTVATIVAGRLVFRR